MLDLTIFNISNINDRFLLTCIRIKFYSVGMKMVSKYVFCSYNFDVMSKKLCFAYNTYLLKNLLYAISNFEYIL